MQNFLFPWALAILRIFLAVYAVLVFSNEPWDRILYYMDIAQATLPVATAIVLKNPGKGMASYHL